MHQRKPTSRLNHQRHTSDETVACRFNKPSDILRAIHYANETGVDKAVQPNSSALRSIIRR